MSDKFINTLRTEKKRIMDEHLDVLWTNTFNAFKKDALNAVKEFKDYVVISLSDDEYHRFRDGLKERFIGEGFRVEMSDEAQNIMVRW